MTELVRAAYLRQFVLLLVFCTGFSALVYEVVWQRYLSNLIGSQARAVALILAVFLGGLCVGYALFGWLSRGRSARELIKLCGWVEVLIGLWALGFPYLYRGLWEYNGILPTGGAAVIISDLMICIILIALPTIGMGATLPLLTQALSRSVGESSSLHAKIYAVNTGGAFLGCVCGGFYLLPALGLTMTILLMAIINCLCGVALVLVSFAEPRAEGVSVSVKLGAPDTSPTQELSLVRAACVALIAGFVAITIQAVTIRLVALSAGASEFAFSLVVAVFVLMLALGAWILASPEKARISLWFNQFVVTAGLLALFASVPFWPYWTHFIRTLLTSVGPNFFIYHLVLLLFFGVLLAIPVGAMGCTMPLLFRSVSKHADRLGDRVGVLYASNTVGCALGALLGGYLALYALDIDQVFLAGVALLALTIFIVANGSKKRTVVRQAVSLLAFAAVLLIAFQARLDRSYFAKGTFRLRDPQPYSYNGRAWFYRGFKDKINLHRYVDGPNTTVAVLESPISADEPRLNEEPISRSLWVNGKSDGSTSGSDLRTTLLLGHVPALFSPEPSEAVVIGFGTGLTVGALLHHPHVVKVDAIEISPAVREASIDFDPFNGGVTKSPRLEWIMGDAYRVLGASSAEYGIIVSEPSNPWVTGVEKLYTKEFLGLAKKRLAPQGIFAQWIHIYSLSEESVATVFSNYGAVFKHVHVVSSGNDLILLGWDHELDQSLLQRARQRMLLPGVYEQLRLVEVLSFESLAGLELWIPISMMDRALPHTLEHPTLAYRAGFDFFLGQTANMRVFYDLPEFASAVTETAEGSLFNLWQQGNAVTPVGIFEYAQAACKKDAKSLGPDWRAEPASCRAASLALLANGLILNEGGLTPLEDALLKAFRFGTILSLEFPASDFAAVSNALALFREANSIFMRLKPEHLVQLVQDCKHLTGNELKGCKQQLEQLFKDEGLLEKSKARPSTS